MKLSDVNLTAQEVMDITKKYMIETYERFPLLQSDLRICICMMKMIMHILTSTVVSR